MIFLIFLIIILIIIIWGFITDWNFVPFKNTDYYKKEKGICFFDIDGTLIDSVSGYHEVIINAMTDLGIKEIDTNFNALKHHTDSYALKYNYEKFFNKEPPLALLDQFENTIVKY